MYQMGGALFSEGAYGCIFYPSMFKSGKYKYVSKIQRNNFSGKNEIYIGSIVKNHPYFLNHFVPVVESQSIDIKKIDDEDINECNIFKKYKTNDFLNMKIYYVKGDNFLTYILNNKSSDFNFVSLLINSYNHLLNSLQMLLSMNIVHYDLKGNNIMFNEINKLPLILDFGLSIKMDELKADNLTKFFYVYAPEYTPWCLEIHYLSYLLKVNKDPSVADLENMVDQMIENDTHPINILFSNSFINKYKRLSLNQLKKYKAMGSVDAISYILSTWKTWDNYSLSIIYMSFFYYIYSSKVPKQDFIKLILETLLLNLHPDPERRLSVKETSLQFNEKLLDFVKNLTNFKYISNLNKDFVKNKKLVKQRVKSYKEKMDTMTKKNKKTI
jgi:hypothetical protein